MNKSEQETYLEGFVILINDWLVARSIGGSENYKKIEIIKDDLSAKWGIVESIIKQSGNSVNGKVSQDDKGKPVLGDIFLDGFIGSARSGEAYDNIIKIKSLALSAKEKLKYGVYLTSDILPNINLVINTMNRFGDVVGRWKYRRKNSNNVEVESEYDVQDFIYTMLIGSFPTIQYENPNSKAGLTSSIADFTIGDIGLLIETKYISSKGNEKTIQEECKQDIISYAQQDKCREIIFFIYDPNKTINNSYAFINGLGKTSSFNGKEVGINTLIVN